jgi:XRE family transcriptional regulator, regulator of sulfur utilization
VLGESIRAHRKTLGLSQEKLAELASLHPNYVGEVERGDKTISVDALFRIATALKVKLRSLFNDL